MSAPISPLPTSRGNQGAALVLVLCFAVLIAGLTVAFFSRVTTERQVSNASANTTKVELLADAAIDVIVDDLKQEITNNSTASGSGTTAIYIPTSGSNAMPARQSAITSGSLANLIRISSHRDVSTRAANALSTGTSFNGRSVSLPRWNLHYLLPLKNSGTPGDSTPDTSFTAPDWVILTRNGPATSPSLNTLSSASSTGYAIGRYAYAIYDEGGLLDVNAVGYPSTTTSTQSGPKGGLAYADLTQLTDASGNSLFTKTQIDQIVGWRNYATTQPSGAFPNYTFDAAAASRYQSLATSGSNTPLYVSGTTYNGNSDHAILNRQQLIKLLQSIGSTPTEKLNLQNALQYLGTFSREVNGPTCSGSGASKTDYNPPHIFDVQVSGTFTRADGSAVVAGEPLVKNRFPLEKLALLEKMQGVSTLSSQDKDDIARYFGLDPVSDSNGYYRHWNYPTTSTKYLHGKGTTGAIGIMSLSDVAAQDREPDFFELLQSGILAGSLGKSGRGDVSVHNIDDPDSKVTLQILRIGANIIDQWDADNYPTIITYAPPGYTGSTSYDVYGIEDLPYLNSFLFSWSGPGTYSSPYDQQYTFSFCFQLWNPHQLTSNTGAYPSNFQISPLVTSTSTLPGTDSISDWYSIAVLASGTDTPEWYWNTATKKWVTKYFGTSSNPYNHFSETGSNGIIKFSISDHSNAYRSTPQISDALLLGTTQGFPDDTILSLGKSWATVSGANSGYACFLTLGISIVYRIQFQDQNGTYRTYGTFVGLDNPYLDTGYKQSPWLSFSNATNSAGKWMPCPKSDPRTFRFGSGQSYDFSNDMVNVTITPSNGSRNSQVVLQAPFNSKNYPYLIDLWAANNITNYSYADNDGQTRFGDAVYSYAASSPVSPLYTSGTSARPVILNRQFRSVGELSYGFRDMPWKTLDFFSANSADAALLDLFSLYGSQSMMGGRLNPNARQPQILAALISGATQASGSGTTVSAVNATAVANAAIALSKATPYTNRADLVTRLMSDSSIGSISTIKTERESIIRALADGSNTRTWNLLIDLVAEVGKYPSTAKNLDQFLVEGERHYWIHVAIDRYTGQIVGRQLEFVNE